MKGDFSRSTFDPRKHYTGVRMQQGRVQLDADWNEQQDILLHLIRTQLKDLLGPGGTAATDPLGFDISLVEPAEEPVDQDSAGQPEEPTQSARTMPDFQIGAGRYYVDGILCENDASVLFSEQPDYPDAASRLAEPVDHDHFLVYLDVWGRHITAVQDPVIREIALGGPDTTTRTQTVWQVKLLPLPNYVAEGDEGHKRGGLRSLPDWVEFVNKAADKGRLRAKWEKDRGAFPENHLYRVEIHTVDGDQATFKWSRENGSVVFPIREEYLFTSEMIELDLEGLDRDPYQLSENNWVEIVDDVTVLNVHTLPLCRVEKLDRPNGKVTLQADEESLKRILAEIGERELQHPLLRRWEDDAKLITPQTDTTTAQSETWLDLEKGIQVGFGDTGSYQVGDYWLIPARTHLDGGIEWPHQDGQPLAQAPHGIAHHYAPLALLQFGDGGWHVIPDATARFATLPQVDARLAQVDVHLGEHVDKLARLRDRVHVLEERKADFQAPLVQYFRIADEINIGHVVSVTPLDPLDEPDSELHVRLTSSENKRDERLVVGVVKDILKDGESCRVVLYGRAQCKVVGEVKPGDVLVPSVKPGYARKAGRLYLRRGTILGKALSSTKFDPEVVEEIEEREQTVESDMSQQPGTVDILVTLG